MGCRLSKINTELVKLCREKRDLIKAARDSRNALAFAHMTYFQSMHSVENELKNFVEEALVICFNSSSETGLDHQTVEGILHSENSSVRSDNDCNGGDDDDDVDDDGDGADDNDEDAAMSFTDYVNESSNSSEHQPEYLSGQLRPLGNFVFPPYGNEIPFGDSAYIVPNSSGLANYASTVSTNYQTSLRPNGFSPTQKETAMLSSSSRCSLPNVGFNLDVGGVSFGGRTDYTFMDSGFFQHESRAQGDYPVNFLSNNSQQNQTYNHYHRPSSPLPHEVSTWDYINPFNLVENTFPNLDFPDTYETSFGSNGMDLTELREREGIPDLEYELDDPIIEDTSSGEEHLASNDDINEFLSEGAALKDGDDVYPDQKEDVRSTGNGLINNGNEKKDGSEINDLENVPRFSASENLKGEEIIRSKACDRQEESIQKEMEHIRERHNLCSETYGTAAEFRSNMLGHSSMDPQETLNEIKEAFDNSSMHGKYVLQMLGSYQPGFTSCIESSTVSSRETSAWACRMFKRSAHRILKMANGNSESLENETSSTLCNLSLTLEKLCIWESKLYEEVKDEEKLRDNFDKECRRLKELDDRGAESSKVEAGRLSLRKLTPRIDVAISTIEGIARRTHKIRDEELQPQLFGLIHRLHKMWKFLFEAHKKQVQAIIKVQANAELTCMTSDSSLNATQKLEDGITKLGTTFSDWIKAQKTFAKLLKNWLSKFLLLEPEEIQLTPTVFTICIDWLHAVEGVSEIDLLHALNNFKVLLHQLRQNLQEERQQRLKIEYLTSYHEKKLKKACMESGMEVDQYASLVGSTSTIESGSLSMDALLEGLRPIRLKLDEATAKHEEATEQVNSVAAHILQIGFVPFLEALESFSLQMCNAYDQIRIPNEGRSQEF